MFVLRLVHNPPMKLRTILTSDPCRVSPAPAQAPDARPTTPSLEMKQAFAQGNKARLAQLLPQARGHAARALGRLLGAARPARHGQRRRRCRTSSRATPAPTRKTACATTGCCCSASGATGRPSPSEHPRFRMNDDREVRCYALLVAAPARRREHAGQRGRRGARASGSRSATPTTAARWPRPPAIGDGRCATASTADRRLAQGAPGDRGQPPARGAAAVEIVAPDALPLLTELNASPAKFLTKPRHRDPRTRREMVVLALIKLATTDPDNAARAAGEQVGPAAVARGAQLDLGRASAGRRRSSCRRRRWATSPRSRATADLTDDMLAWKVRAALRARPTARTGPPCCPASTP